VIVEPIHQSHYELRIEGRALHDQLADIRPLKVA